MHGAPPMPTGVPAILAAVFPAFGASDAGKALAIRAADVADAILSIAEAARG